MIYWSREELGLGTNGTRQGDSGRCGTYEDHFGTLIP